MSKSHDQHETTTQTETLQVPLPMNDESFDKEDKTITRGRSLSTNRTDEHIQNSKPVRRGRSIDNKTTTHKKWKKTYEIVI